MILCNLAVLLAERKLKISKVAADTGISRTTLTALYYGSGKGVQFDTANMLCIYLGITIGELFTTVPFDLFIENCIVENQIHGLKQGKVRFECKYIDQRNTEYPYIEASFRPDTTHEEDIILALHRFQPDNSETENRLLTELFRCLPHDGVSVLKSRFWDAFYEAYDRKYEKAPFFLCEMKIPDAFVCNVADIEKRGDCCFD